MYYSIRKNGILINNGIQDYQKKKKKGINKFLKKNQKKDLNHIKLFSKCLKTNNANQLKSHLDLITRLQSSSEYTETLFEMNLRSLKKDELLRLCRKYNLPVSGTKIDLIQRLEKLMRSNSVDMEETERSPYIQLYEEMIQKIEYKNQADLIDKLCRMNQTELRKMVKSKGIISPCRKMQLVQHLSSFIMRDKAPMKEFSIKPIRMKDLENSNAASLQLILHEQGEPKCFGRIEELRQRVYACMVKEGIMRSTQYVSSIENIKELIDTFVISRRTDRILSSEVKRRLDIRGIAFTSEDSNEKLIDLLFGAFNKEYESYKIEVNEDEEYAKLEELAKKWIEVEMELLCKDSILEKLDELTEEKLDRELEKREMRLKEFTQDQKKTILKKIMSVELNLVNRAIALVAAKLDGKVAKLDKMTLFSVLSLDPLPQKKRIKHKRNIFVHEEFRTMLAEKLRPHILSIFERQMDKIEKIKKELETYKKKKDVPKKDIINYVEDLQITVSVVFGGSKNTFSKTLDDLRCLLDHLQSASYPSEQSNELENDEVSEMENRGINIIAYFIDWNLNIYQMNAAQVLSLDFDNFNFNQKNKNATKLKNLNELKSEFEKSHVIMSLLNGIHEDKWFKLKNLIHSFDSKLIGNSFDKIQFLSNKYKTLNILREKGYPTLPSFPLAKTDLKDIKSWIDKFKKWTNYIGIDKRENKGISIRSVWDGASFDIKVVNTVAEAISKAIEQAEEGYEIIIQPFLHHKKAVQFSCTVIQCPKGPVALVPTEIEVLDDEYLRPLSPDTYRHTPPCIDFEKIQAMRLVACQIFKDLKLRDYAVVNGWILTDNSEKSRNKSETLPLPRPIPELKEDDYKDVRNTYVLELEEEYQNLIQDREKDIDAFVEAYESTPWTEEGLNYVDYLGKFFMVDGEEPVDLKKEMDDHITRLKNRHKKGEEVADPDLSSLSKKVQNKLLKGKDNDTEEEIINPVDYGDKKSNKREAWINNICNGEDYIVIVSSIDYTNIFEYNSVLFLQAAVSGLSHSMILRHILDTGLERIGHKKLIEIPPEPTLYNPLFPETYDTEKIPDEELKNPRRSTVKNAHINKFPPNNVFALDEILTFEKIHLKAPKPLVSSVPINELAFVEKPTQVWVLCGGDGTGSQGSFASGINTWLKLKKSTDLQVYPFLLEPSAYTAGNRHRLKELIDRRNKTMELGVPEYDLFKELQKDYIRNPELIKCDMPWRTVWALSYDAALHLTIDEAIESARRDLNINSIARHMRESKIQAFEDTKLAVQRDLHLSGMEKVSSLWDSSYDEIAPASRQMTLDMFATEAMVIGAVIYVDVSGEMAQDGTLLNFLESFNLIHTGCNVNVCGLCGDKSETSKAIADFESDLITSLPQRIITKSNIIEAANDISKAESLFSEAASWLEETPSLCIKPTNGSFNEGVANLRNPADLSIYAEAIKKRIPMIEGHWLSGIHRDVFMPNPAPSEFIVEPYVKTGKISIKNDIYNLEDDNPWIEVTFGLLGDLGQMWAMVPSLILDNLESEDVTLIDRYLLNKRPLITPIPESICGKDVITTSRQSIEKIADRLGLKGIARVDAFLNTKSAQLVIIEIDMSPSVSIHSPILQQAALDDPPMYPSEIFENVLDIAITPKLGPDDETSEPYQVEKIYEPLVDPFVHMQRQAMQRRLGKLEDDLDEDDYREMDAEMLRDRMNSNLKNKVEGMLDDDANNDKNDVAIAEEKWNSYPNK